MTVGPVPHQRSYVYGIDVIRFAAAILVALFHLTWLEKSVSSLAWYGWIGVQVFFVISGFVIAQSANNTTPIKFARSRFLRLYPAAWICAAINLAILVSLNDVSSALPKVFFASLTLYPTGPFLASAYWTLPIEISFYILIFAILMSQLFHRIEVITAVICTISSLYIIAYSLHCADIIHYDGLEFGYYSWKNLLILRHGIYFSCGIFLWLWSEGLLSRIGMAAGVLGLCAAPLEITCRSAEILALMPVRLSLSSAWPIPVGIWLACCGLIAAAAFWRRAIMCAPPTMLKGVRWIGLTTYPLYLIHENVGKTARNILLGVGLPYLVSALLALGLAAIVGLIVACAGEPALRNVLRERMTAKRAGSAPRGWLLYLDRPGGNLMGAVDIDRVRLAFK